MIRSTVLQIILITLYCWNAFADDIKQSTSTNKYLVSKCADFSYAGSALWSLTYDMKIKDNFAYCGMSNGIQVIDVQDPSNPNVVNHVYTGDQIRSIDIQGDKLYAGGKSLHVYDIQNPLALKFCGQYNSEGQVFAVKIRDCCAFLYYNNSINIIDVSNPAFCKLIGTTSISHGSTTAADIELDGSLAYLATDDIYIFDISDMEAPSEISHFDTPYFAVDLDKQDSLLFVIDYSYTQPATSSSISILNIANPSMPKYISGYDIRGELGNIHILDNYALVSAGLNGFAVFDISNINEIELISCLQPFGRAGAFDIAENVIVLSNGKLSIVDIPGYGQNLCKPPRETKDSDNSEWGRILTIDMTDISSLVPIAEIPQSGYCKVAKAADDWLIVSSDQGYVNLLDISIPDTISEVSRIITPRAGTRTALSDNILAVANELYGLYIYDITIPRNPVLLKNLSDLGILNDVYLHNNNIFVTGQSGFSIYDISEPSNPILIGNCIIPDFANEFIVVNDYAFVTGRYSGFHVVDLSDSFNPYIAASSPEPFWAYNIALGNNKLFVAGGSVISVFDVSNPLAPVKTNDIVSQSIQDIAVFENYLIVTRAYEENIIYDITNVTAPRESIRFETPVVSLGTCVSKEHIYVCDYASIIRYTLSSSTDIEDDGHGGLIPFEHRLYQNYPNPFNSGTSISYYLSYKTDVQINIYNVLGKKVKEYNDGQKLAGDYSIYWDCTDQKGDFVSSGLYICELCTKGSSLFMKMLFLK